MIKNKKAQEEMVGFALIIIVVAVIILIFLGFSLRSPEKETVESYEVESFIQSFLQYTTECRNNIEALSIQKLIFVCNDNPSNQCLDVKNSCSVLNTELENMLKESWKVGENRPVKGYELNIISDSRIEPLVSITEGEITGNSKGSIQEFFKGGSLIEITFKAYY